jgi:hypothetical protein
VVVANLPQGVIVEHLCVVWQHHKGLCDMTWRAIGPPGTWSQTCAKKSLRLVVWRALGSTRNGHNSLRDVDGLYRHRYWPQAHSCKTLVALPLLSSSLQNPTISSAPDAVFWRLYGGGEGHFPKNLFKNLEHQIEQYHAVNIYATIL